jgi:VWFA-related protein
MKKHLLVLELTIAITVLLSSVQLIFAQENPAAVEPGVNLLVTVEARHGSNVPDITRDDVMVYEGKDRDRVTGWLPLHGDHAGLEFFILIDDSSSVSLGSQLEDIRQYINAQPPTTKIGVAYMQNGTAQVVQNLTNDHALAAKALRLPLGSPGASASPYFSLEDLIKRWPASEERHEVLLITDGIDRYWGSGPDNAYVDTVIEKAQRAGVIVYSIYTPGEGHFGHSYWRTYWGQNYLSQLSDETGGESYYLIGSAPPVTFTPYLEDMSRKLNQQYLLTFIAKPEKKAGMRRIKLQTEVPNAELVSADRVYVPATPQ